MVSTTRPRLLYFNGPWDYLGDRIRRSYIEPLQRLLEQDFEVISVEGDCDFRREVKAHRPDVAFFHTGIECNHEPEVTIANCDAFPELPRMGWMARDPFSPSRLQALNRLRAWRVDQVFYLTRASDSPTPLMANAIYVPWWIDESVFRDYGEPKLFPISFTGSGWLEKQFYTWRHPVFVQLVQKLPVYHVPSFLSHQKQEVYVGESYARLLNQSLISGGCGSACRYLTLKLMEIPAARSCLITEETEILKALGFIDGVNCVFITAENAVSKVQALLDDPVRLQAITDAGHQLVHEQHTRRNRRMFIDWYRLWKQRRPGQRVAQCSPGELRLIDAHAEIPPAFPRENPLNDRIFAGYKLIEEGRWTDAIKEFAAVGEIIPYVAEAQLGLAICHLNLGQAVDAIRIIGRMFSVHTKDFAYLVPDPLTLAFFVIALIKSDREDSAVDVLAQQTAVKHPALNALRWVAAQRWPDFRRKYPDWRGDEGNETQAVDTLHLLPARSFFEWTEYWTAYLNPQPSPVASL